MKSWADVSLDLLQKVMNVIRHDGHSIWDEDVFIKMGIDRVLLPIHYYQSGNTHKESIYKNGKILESVGGVYGLTLLERIVSDLNLKYVRKIGRGFQASSITEAIDKHIVEMIVKRI